MDERVESASGEDRDGEDRDGDDRRFFAAFPRHLAAALAGAPGLKRHLGTADPATIASRAALATLPVLRKPALMAAQEADPPFGGFAVEAAMRGVRLFQSPGPILEPEGPGPDPFRAAPALRAAGLRAGDRLLNTFSYHLTPGAHMVEAGARSIGANVVPAGPGNSDALARLAATLRVTAYAGTPDFLKAILDKGDEGGHDLAALRLAFVSGGALFPALRATYEAQGIRTFQAYATADLGVIAYETATSGTLDPGLRVNEGFLVEIVRPGTDDALPDGEVGEVVVSTLNPAYPLVRFGTGDLSCFLPGGMRLKGWMGRADQRTKVKGMFVDPAQVATLAKRFAGISRLRLVVSRDGDRDRMVLRVQPSLGAAPDIAAIEAAMRDVFALRGSVEIVEALPNDGVVIEDARDYSR